MSGTAYLIIYLWFIFEAGSHYVAQADLEFEIPPASASPVLEL
jgi:hypothetical protein